MYVQAFRDIEDGDFKKMMDIKLFCEKQGVSLPKEVDQYFGKYSLDPEEYIKEQMSEVKIPKEAAEEGSDERVNGNYIEIDVALLPKEVKKLRFVVSF